MGKKKLLDSALHAVGVRSEGGLPDDVSLLWAAADKCEGVAVAKERRQRLHRAQFNL